MNAECRQYISTNKELETIIFKVDTRKIHEVLLNIGIPPNVLGYCYILYALELILFKPEYLRLITTELYPAIAERFNTTPSRVERDIRTAINTAWLRGDLVYINRTFGSCVDPNRGVPSNSLFLSRVYYYITSEK